jgi:hypothetical protein
MTRRRSVLVMRDQPAISATERPQPRQRPVGRSISQTLMQGVSMGAALSMLVTAHI